MSLPDKKAKKAAKQTPPRLLQVVRTVRLTPVVQRITLGGNELTGFPADRNGAHIKVFLPRAGQFQPMLPGVGENGPIWPAAHLRPVTRTYSVRRYRADVNELDIDFVLHGNSGPASAWALKVKPGDSLGVAGPGGPYPLLQPADWHLLVGDLTALPAISALLEDLPPWSRGRVLIEIDQYDHRQTLQNNTAMPVTWIQNDTGAKKQGYNVLLEAVRKAIPPVGVETLSAFVAGENSAVIGIRDYLRYTYGLTKAQLYAVPYWHRGRDEESYHQERHRIMDQVY